MAHEALQAVCLMKLRDAAEEYDLPGVRQVFLAARNTAFVEPAGAVLTMAELSKKSHVIIYGERGHWAERLHDCLIKALGRGAPRLVLRMPSWRIEDIKGLDKAEEERLRSGVLAAEGTVQRLQIFRQFVLDRVNARSKEKPINVLIHNFSSLKFEEALAFAHMLRQLGDSYGDSLGCRFFVFSSSYLPFADRADCSAYEALADSYRLPGWSREMICQRAAGFTDGKATHALHIPAEPGTAMDLVLDHTGGHPLLVDQLLRRLADLVEAGGAVSEDDIDEGMRQMRASPPSECDYWLEQLETILRQEPMLRHRLLGYVRGETRGPAMFPPPRDEKELYVAGWLGTNRLGRWGMTSLFHAHLARDVVCAQENDHA